MTIDCPIHFIDTVAAVHRGWPHQPLDTGETATLVAAVCEALARRGEHSASVRLMPETDDAPPTALFEVAGGFAVIAGTQTLAITRDGAHPTRGLNADEIAAWLHAHSDADAGEPVSRFALIDTTGTVPRPLDLVPQIETDIERDPQLRDIVAQADRFAMALHDVPTGVLDLAFSYTDNMGIITDAGEVIAVATPRALVSMPSPWSSHERILDDAAASAFVERNLAQARYRLTTRSTGRSQPPQPSRP